ncbi:hypothetical protein FISHEDRAFT_68120 [Fistulina hepatica ATCC 64428]|uniref:Meiotic sister chromatid recombination protein 1 n=1 Tax=Fistulina hepatica ATCC 64428 TaxID=1128425 RepID=A0A0D7A0K4_9AGAR|nr:hypothetical protein FISHEDRAFT_68120 [Fistulina hepatica ATCC 64428]
MKTSLLLLALAAVCAASSWFGSDQPTYTSWSDSQLRKWLKENDVPFTSSDTTPQLVDRVRQYWDSASAWTYDQYTNAQHHFGDLKETAFETWDDSRLREFLLEQGIVHPTGPREQLILMAKHRYRGYTNAASSFVGTASSIWTGATSTAASHASQVTDFAKDTYRSMSSIGDSAYSALDDTKDYIYSTWDDSRLQAFLVDQGVIKSKEKKTRNQLLGLMRNTYRKTISAVWESWSDSYIYKWLVDNGLVSRSSSGAIPSREQLIDKMKFYYHGNADKIYSTWSDFDMKTWLVDNGIIKNDAKVTRDKMHRLISDNYNNAKSSVWSSWTDSDLKNWLVSHGFMKSDAQKRRDELVELVSSKYNAAADYISWPDTRLRAFLRKEGLDEEALYYMDRDSLLKATRTRYSQGRTNAEALWAKLREIVNSSVERAEEGLNRVLQLLQLQGEKGKAKADETGDWLEKEGKAVCGEARGKYDEAREKVKIEL